MPLSEVYKANIVYGIKGGEPVNGACYDFRSMPKNWAIPLHGMKLSGIVIKGRLYKLKNNIDVIAPAPSFIGELDSIILKTEDQPWQSSAVSFRQV